MFIWENIQLAKTTVPGDVLYECFILRMTPAVYLSKVI